MTSLLQEAAQKIAYMHRLIQIRGRKVERSVTVDPTTIRVLQPGEDLRTMRTRLPVFDGANLVGWKVDDAICEPLHVTFDDSDADDETAAA